MKQRIAAKFAALGLAAGLAHHGAQAQTSSQAPGAPASFGGLQGKSDQARPYFRRVASFPVFLNTSAEEQTAAEIVASADGGNLLVYTDSPTGNVGFVDISDPRSPEAAGVVPVDGQPTSVAVLGRYALVAVNTSPDFVNTSGNLEVIDVFTRQIVATIPLGGQPDSVTVSPDRQYAAVVIENERDEDFGNGEPPQLPGGFLVIVDLVGGPTSWTTRNVDLTGVPDLFPTDPEPEYADINGDNIAVVTMQENNHIALVRLSDGTVIGDFPAGTADLVEVDVEEEGLIQQTGALANVPREPDAVAWTSDTTFATADEGDLFGGSRGFTTWFPAGFPLFEAGNALEHIASRSGHYPEDRSENKGGEVEGIEFARFAKRDFLFVGSERANTVAVYTLHPTPVLGNSNPNLYQVLPTGVGPEGLHAIPERDLFVVACETDERGDKIRSTIMIYERAPEASYPTIESADRAGTSLPIPWGGLSALVVDPDQADTLYTLYDSVYQQSRIFRLDVSTQPAVIEDETPLIDSNGALLGALEALLAALPPSATADFDPSALVNADGTVNVDAEGVAVDAGGAFWVASEGAGNLVDGVSDPDDRPFESPNLLIEVQADGTIDEVVLLPIGLTQDQLRFGFEGVAARGDHLYVAFQRAWTAAGDLPDRARIGRYERSTGTWGFAYYPLEAPTSPNGGFVGLSELTDLGNDTFAVIERDDQGGPDAAIKRIYSFSVAGVTFQDETQVPGFDLVVKSLESDLLADDVYAVTGGLVPEKQEDSAVLPDGAALIVNDNDGVADNNGETQLIRIDGLFD